MNKYITIFALWAFSSLTFASCEGLAEKLNAELYPIENGTARDLRFSNCKVWPFDPSKTIVVLVHFKEGSSIAVPPNDTEGLYDLTVLLVTSDAGKILNRLSQVNAFTSDAIMLDGIAIDTAPYKLGQNLRAFGVRATFNNSSSVSSWEHSQIALYVTQDNKLKQVLERLVVNNKRYEQVDDCIETLVNINRTLSISSTSSFGFADLLVKEKMVVDEGKKESSDCKVTNRMMTKDYILHFDGTTYVVPEEMRY